MLSESTISAVRDLPITDVVGKYVELKKRGAAYLGLCPFHTEHTPSFNVTPAKQMCKCFGCGKGGDGIWFVMEKENLLFLEAVEKMAADHGIKIEYDETKKKRTPEEIDKRSKSLVALRTASLHYNNLIGNSNEILSYLHQTRNLKPETISNWHIGFAPNDNKFLTSSIIKNGFWEAAEAAGIVRGTNGNSHDFFYNRIIIPIESANGDVVSFGGRKLPTDTGDGPKYLNTANTIVYDKSKILFGLSKARRAIAEQGCAVIMEGYFDVIKAHQCGWENAVATCGTALTAQHSKQLKKYTDRIVLMRDGDKAGRRAIEKDIEVLSHDFSDVKIIFLPEGHDPDSLFDKFEEPICFETLQKLTDAYEWQCIQWLSHHAEEDTAALSKGIEKCVTLLSRLPNANQRDIYFSKLAARFKLKEAQFKKEFKSKNEGKQIDLTIDEELPKWVDTKKLYADSFVMNYEGTQKDKIGIYFKGESRPVIRLTNFVIKPLYFIMDPSNSRRMIEMYNGIKHYVVELSNKSLVSQDFFETEITGRPGFYTEPGFGKVHFKRLVNWINDHTKIVHELNTLGWQPEGFFAFSNMIIVPASEENKEEVKTVTDGGKN